MRHRPLSDRAVSRRVVSRVVAAGTGLVLAAALVGPAVPAHAESTARYIVTTTSSSATDSKVKKLRSAKAPVGRQFRHVLHGFAASLTEDQVAQLKSDPSVESVRKVTKMTASDIDASAVGRETSAPWGLDRIDQRSGRDGSYFYNSTGAGVTAYVLDTGIRTDHTDFGGRASSGLDLYPTETCTPAQLADEASHGTHVAGTIGGTKYGVAKQVALVSVRVLPCNGEGNVETVIAGLDWVAANHPSTPSVVNLSLGGNQNLDVDAAVQALIDLGIPVVAAAGNDYDDACYYSPAGVPAAITVGASDSSDHQAYWGEDWQGNQYGSNWGSCLDLFAPGDEVASDGAASKTSALTMSGTSMATPHVVGAVARYLETHPTATPAEVSSAIVDSASPVASLDEKDASPAKLLYLYSEKTPSAPTSFHASRSDKSKTVSITWGAPSATNGFPVTGYRVVRTGVDAAGKASQTVDLSATTRSYTFKGLKAGTTYTVSVQAKNAIGFSAAASIKQTITALPGKPKITSATKGSKGSPVTIGVKWSKPTSGGAVKSYVVTATRSGSTKTDTVSGSARSATVSGLKKNKKYTVRLRAVNDSGTGATVTYGKTVKAR